MSDETAILIRIICAEAAAQIAERDRQIALLQAALRRALAGNSKP